MLLSVCLCVHTKIGNSTIGCTINGSQATLQAILKNGDLVNIEASKMPHAALASSSVTVHSLSYS